MAEAEDKANRLFEEQERRKAEMKAAIARQVSARKESKCEL